jgi:phosphatidylserine decarboxylase
MPWTPRRAGLSWLAIGSAAATAGWFWLRRDPLRLPPDEVNAILAPADGKVLLIEHGSSPGWVEEPAWRIAIYLSLMDVHVQRAPDAGYVGLSENRHGSYHPAYKPQATANAGHALGLENQHGRILVIRSAGIIARRVITTVHEGDIVVTGQRIGRILLGSRAEVYLPGTVEVCVQPGDTVRAGETILAHWKD